jgi:hypothetical protein
MMALAPGTVQNIPDCLRREPITVLAASFDHTRADEQVLVDHHPTLMIHL